jgi:nitrogen fixation protein FixH
MSEAIMKKESFSQANPKALKNPWVLGWLALVSVVLVVNIGFISLAFITNPGLVDQDYYEKAEDYEKNLIKYRNARAALGWSYQAIFPVSPVMNKKELYRLSIVDKVGQPLTAANINLIAYRPSDASADFEVTLAEVDAGIYEGYVNYPLKGIWEITAVIERDGNKYDFTRRASIVTP